LARSWFSASSNALAQLVTYLVRHAREPIPRVTSILEQPSISLIGLIRQGIDRDCIWEPRSLRVGLRGGVGLRSFLLIDVFNRLRRRDAWSFLLTGGSAAAAWRFNGDHHLVQWGI